MDVPRPAPPVSAPSWRQYSEMPPLSALAAPTRSSPSLSHLETAKPTVHPYHHHQSSTNSTGPGGIKYEKEHNDRVTLKPALSAIETHIPAPSMPSHTAPYPGPPPPYTSHYSNATSAPTTQQSQSSHGGLPESRRDSYEDRGSEATTRQALPSISEALAKLPGMSPVQHAATATTTTAPPPPPPHHQTSHHHSHASHTAGYQANSHAQTPGGPVANPETRNAYPSISLPRSEVYPPVPARSYSPNGRHNSFDSREGGRLPGSRAMADSPALNQHRTSLSSTGVSPVEPPGPQHMSPRMQHAYNAAPQAQYYSHALPSPQQGPNQPQSASSANGSFPPTQLQGSQPSYNTASPHASASHQPAAQPAYAYSFPPPAGSGITLAESLREAALVQPPPQRQWQPNSDLDEVDKQRHFARLSSADQGGSYALTVKRVLEDFGLEDSLNELAERTKLIMDFSKYHGSRAYQYPRTLVPLQELPTVEDCDQMLEHANQMRGALERLRRAVVERNHLEEQTASQKGASGYQAFGSDGGSNGHAGNKGNEQNEIPTGGFSGSDPKKPRRGRNAAPGRCHSCNRVETPEWRRGPDGARTLCNACGLHYAKLTRKLGKENKNNNDTISENQMAT